jgi:hypothetical protein
MSAITVPRMMAAMFLRAGGVSLFIAFLHAFCDAQR